MDISPSKWSHAPFLWTGGVEVQLPSQPHYPFLEKVGSD